jgi:hypothetical protein
MSDISTHLLTVLHKGESEETVEKLSIQGKHFRLQTLKGLCNCRSLKALDVSRNTLVTIEGVEILWRLEILNVASNRLSDLGELLRLRGLEALQTVDLRGNPLTHQESYRLFAIKYLPRVRRLDGYDITAEERAQAEQLFANLDYSSSSSASAEGSACLEHSQNCARSLATRTLSSDSDQGLERPAAREKKVLGVRRKKRGTTTTASVRVDRPSLPRSTRRNDGDAALRSMARARCPGASPGASVLNRLEDVQWSTALDAVLDDDDQDTVNPAPHHSPSLHSTSPMPAVQDHTRAQRLPTPAASQPAHNAADSLRPTRSRSPLPVMLRTDHTWPAPPCSDDKDIPARSRDSGDRDSDDLSSASRDGELGQRVSQLVVAAALCAGATNEEALRIREGMSPQIAEVILAVHTSYRRNGSVAGGGGGDGGGGGGTAMAASQVAQGLGDQAGAAWKEADSAAASAAAEATATAAAMAAAEAEAVRLREECAEWQRRVGEAQRLAAAAEARAVELGCVARPFEAARDSREMVESEGRGGTGIRAQTPRPAAIYNTNSLVQIHTKSCKFRPLPPHLYLTARFSPPCLCRSSLLLSVSLHSLLHPTLSSHSLIRNPALALSGSESRATRLAPPALLRPCQRSGCEPGQNRQHPRRVPHRSRPACLREATLAKLSEVMRIIKGEPEGVLSIEEGRLCAHAPADCGRRV